jgi:hypothetical protein
MQNVSKLANRKLNIMAIGGSPAISDWRNQPQLFALYSTLSLTSCT